MPASPKKMNRKGQSRPTPNKKQAAKGGAKSSRKGTPNKASKK